uniref:Peptidase M14 carboxypeptidase A domain-containing protein n=2 Tax=Parascaris univalens TaxID=6257 RepID=A0A915B421_PARUN
MLALIFAVSAILCWHLSAEGRTTVSKEHGRTPQFDFDRYHDYYEMKRYMLSVAAMNPEFVQLRDIGTTHEGRRLLGLKIGYPASAINKRAVWLDGGNHAREWPAFHTAVFFIDQLVTNYGINESITNYINKLNIYVFPVLNPDGFEYSLTSDEGLIRHWRKNRAPENCTGVLGNREDICCIGVDLNRNFDFAFAHRSVPYNNPCSDEFQGPYPFSEPETRAIRDFMYSSEIYGRLDALVSLHTYGQLFIFPYNHQRRNYPEDIHDLRSLAEKAVDEIRAFRGTKYELGTAADILAPATGGAIDWIKKFTPTKYVYVVELPPRLSSWFGFQMKPHWLLPTAQETWHGIRVIIDQVLHEANLDD